jgi:hypothetical protein
MTLDGTVMTRSYANIASAIDSTATGGNVARRRYQKGSVYKNKAKTVWLGMYAEHVLDSNGIEKRKRKQVILGPVRDPSGNDMRKREAQRRLQPFVDRVNSSLSATVRESKRATFASRAWDPPCGIPCIPPLQRFVALLNPSATKDDSGTSRPCFCGITDS